MKLRPDEPHEEELIPLLVAGDPTAWRQLCEGFGVPLYRYCYWLAGGDPATAEDLRQETFLAAIHGIERFRGEVPLFAWLSAIARHKAVDELRLRRRHVSLSEVREEPVSAVSPEADAAMAEQCADVVETLWSLPRDYRIALLSRYMDDETVEAVALRLGRSYKAAESVLSRARKAFFERFRKVQGHERRFSV